MLVSLSVFGGVGWQFFDNNGDPLSGGKIYTYVAGTTTPLTTYTTATGTIPHTNPIVLDAAGKVPSGGEIWLDATIKYKFVLKTSTDVLLNTYDNVGGNFNTSLLVSNFVGDGTTTVYTLIGAPTNESVTNVYINGVYQQKNTFAVVSDQLTFSQAPPKTASIEVVYF